MRELIFSSIRAFLIATFSLIGVAVGIVFFILIISSASDTKTEEPEQYFTKEIAPNAEGIRKTVSSDKPVILKIDINGIIGTDNLSTAMLQRQLIESREGSLKDNRVKAILLCINSPGGTVNDANGIYQALKTYKEQYKVPIYAYVEGLCASGGMYVAAASDQIYSNDVTIIGSIGVLSPSFVNVSKLLDKIGVDSLTLTAGKDKDALNPLRPWQPGESENLQHLINYYYQMFVDIITTNRPQVNREKLINEYGAKVFNAQQAQEFGLINVPNATYRSTLKDLLKAVNIVDENYQVVQMKHTAWYKDLFKSEWGLFSGKITHYIQFGPELDPQLNNQFLYLYRP